MDQPLMTPSGTLLDAPYAHVPKRLRQRYAKGETFGRWSMCQFIYGIVGGAVVSADGHELSHQECIPCLRDDDQVFAAVGKGLRHPALASLRTASVLGCAPIAAAPGNGHCLSGAD
jgi:hypothetical protein